MTKKPNKKQRGTKIELKLTKRKKRLKTEKHPKLKPGQRVLIPFPEQQTHEPGWKETIPPVTAKRFFKLLDKLVKIRGTSIHGSYYFSLKLNGGYGKNHDNGATIFTSFTGPLSEIYNVIGCSGIENKVKLNKIKFDN